MEEAPLGSLHISKMLLRYKLPAKWLQQCGFPCRCAGIQLHIAQGGLCCMPVESSVEHVALPYSPSCWPRAISTWILRSEVAIIISRCPSPLRSACSQCQAAQAPFPVLGVCSADAAQGPLILQGFSGVWLSCRVPAVHELSTNAQRLALPTCKPQSHAPPRAVAVDGAPQVLLLKTPHCSGTCRARPKAPGTNLQISFLHGLHFAYM